MVHIGMITADLSHKHGWAHYSLELARALTRAGAQVTIIAGRLNNDPTPDLTVHPFLPMRRFVNPRLLAYIPKARRLLRDCDVIQCTVEPLAMLAWAAAQGRPLFQAGVGSYLKIREWQRPLFIPLYQKAFDQSTITAISHASGRVAAENFPLARVEVVPLGINATRFAALQRQPNHGGPIVLSVGGIKPRKGTLHTVRAMATVRREYPAARLVILGNPYPQSDYTQRIMAEITRLNLTDTVQIRGFVDDVELLDWYARADVFAMPSMNEGWEFEGFGLVHLEASAAALPVIGARDTGNEDAIEHGVTGYLVSQEGIDDELPRYLLALLNDPSLRQRMGQAGRARAMHQTWDSVAQQYLALYQDALAQKGRR